MLKHMRKDEQCEYQYRCTISLQRCCMLDILKYVTNDFFKFTELKIFHDIFNHEIAVQLAGNVIVNPLLKREMWTWQIVMRGCINEGRCAMSNNKFHFVCVSAWNCSCCSFNGFKFFELKMFCSQETCYLAHTNNPQHITPHAQAQANANAHCPHT